MLKEKSLGRLTGLFIKTSVLISLLCLWIYPAAMAGPLGQTCRTWEKLGARAAFKSVAMFKTRGKVFGRNAYIALTNAGYAEVQGEDTMGALDGLSRVLGVSRGDHSLVEVQSTASSPLWFAVYNKESGMCAYLEVNPGGLEIEPENLFSVTSVENIQADTIFADPETYAGIFSLKPFGGNEFRIVTIVNAIAGGAPSYAVRSFEFHDHYCPGVTSGILMAQLVKTQFPLTWGGKYFVHSVQPWCKEDALIVMLNATPGKKSYAVSYSTDEDKSQWAEEVKDAATIVYRTNEQGLWEGIVLGMSWADTGCPTTGNSLIDKLCSDLYYLDHLGTPADFVQILYSFTLSEGQTPQDFARPGQDPMALLGLTTP